MKCLNQIIDTIQTDNHQEW